MTSEDARQYLVCHGVNPPKPQKRTDALTGETYPVERLPGMLSSETLLSHRTNIRNFMLVFGPLSSVFDYLTFGVLLFVLHAPEEQFRTDWFLESVTSVSVIVLVIMAAEITKRIFYERVKL